MILFKRLPAPPVAIAVSAERAPAFRLGADPSEPARLCLLVQPVGSVAAPEVIWFRDCASVTECKAILKAVEDKETDPVFLGRQALLLGTAMLETTMDALAAADRKRLAQAEEEAHKHAEAHARIGCYAPDEKGWFYLTLKRDSASKPEWQIAFRGRAERERLRDWVRWQSDRFSEFLDYAAKHGAHALEKRLVDEMFKTEKRVKNEGRGAGGARPLRMWRGE